jgi:hypothetical protein
MLVVCGVGGVDLGRTVPGEESRQGLIDQRRVRNASAASPRSREQLRVDGGADPGSGYGIRIA